MFFFLIIALQKMICSIIEYPDFTHEICITRKWKISCLKLFKCEQTKDNTNLTMITFLFHFSNWNHTFKPRTIWNNMALSAFEADYLLNCWTYRNTGLRWFIIFDFQQLSLLPKIDPTSSYGDRTHQKS